MTYFFLKKKFNNSFESVCVCTCTCLSYFHLIYLCYKYFISALDSLIVSIDFI